MFLVATLNSNAQTKTKPFQTARAELPSLPARFCKIWNANFLKIFTFSQEFLLSWDKDLDFLLAGHWEYMFLLLLEFFPHVILITWGLESGLAKFFLQNLFLYGKFFCQWGKYSKNWENGLFPPCLFSKACSSFHNENWYKEVTLYPMDLPWKKFWCPKTSWILTFCLLNLSSALLNFEASQLPTWQDMTSFLLRKW